MPEIRIKTLEVALTSRLVGGEATVCSRRVTMPRKLNLSCARSPSILGQGKGCNAFEFAAEENDPLFLFRRQMSGQRIAEFWFR
jgi:hypothetical protein